MASDLNSRDDLKIRNSVFKLLTIFINFFIHLIQKEIEMQDQRMFRSQSKF